VLAAHRVPQAPSVVAELRFFENPLDRGPDLQRRGVTAQANARASVDDPGCDIVLVSEQWDTDDWHAVGERLHDRTVAALGYQRIDSRKYRVVRDEIG
jgi:hypothetical protein